MKAMVCLVFAASVVAAAEPAQPRGVVELVDALHRLDGYEEPAAKLASLDVLRANAAAVPWVCSELARRLSSAGAGRYSMFAFLAMPAQRAEILGVRSSGFCRPHLGTVLTLLAGTTGGDEIVEYLSRDDFARFSGELGFWLQSADWQRSADVLTRAAEVRATEFLPIAARYLASRKVLDRLVHDGPERRQWSLVATRALLNLGADGMGRDPEIRAALERCVEIIEWPHDEQELGGPPSPEADRRQMARQVKAVLRSGTKDE